MPHKYDKIKDFKLDKPKSDEWIKYRYEKWVKELKSDEYRLINEYVDEFDKFNEILKEYSGSIDKIDSNKYPGIKEKFEKLDKLIKADINKLQSPKDIYLSYSLKNLGLPNDLVIVDDKIQTTLDKNSLRNILNFEFGNLLGFELGSMIKNIEGDQKLMIRLTIPEGYYLGCINDDKVIIPSNYDMQINKSKITTFKGSEIILLKATLKDKGFINKKIDDIQLKLVSKFQGLNKAKDFIKFDINKGFESYTLNFAKLSVDSLINNFPRKLFRDCIGNNLNQIIFTDKDIQGDSSIRGKYDHITKILYLKPNSNSFLLDKDKSTDEKTAILHEAAHIADFYILGLSRDPIFAQHFNKEKNNLTDIITYKGYAKSDIKEYFAEIFKAMFSPYSSQRKEVERQAPTSVEYIRNEISQL